MQPTPHDFYALFERFLQLPAGNLENTLSEAADLVAEALGADKVDVFVYHPQRASLVSLGTSRQPLSALQRQAGLDVLPLANRGLIVDAFTRRESLLVGNSLDDPDELRGIRELLKLDSQIVVHLDIGGKPHGALAVASRTRNRWTLRDLRFAESVARWVGIIAHRAELLRELERRSIAEGRRTAAEELVTMVAHDLRNHLAPLRLRLDSLCRRAERDQRRDDIREVNAALSGVSRVTAFVSDLLDVARIDRDLFELSPEPIDMVALVHEVARGASTEHKRVRVSAPLAVRVVVDPLRIRQCLENLVANALAHTPHGSAVTMRVASHVDEAGTWARTEVIDEGPGIDAQILPHIFDRFVSGMRAQRGLGLGLYIAKQIATLHGGDLSADSVGGRGARFVLDLPLRA